MSNTGKGRLASQDASFTSSSTKLCSINPTTSNPVTISEFFKQEAHSSFTLPTSTPITRTTSSSGSGETMRRKSGKGLFAKGEEDEITSPGRMRRISSSLGIGMFRSVSKTESLSKYHFSFPISLEITYDLSFLKVHLQS